MKNGVILHPSRQMAEGVSISSLLLPSLGLSPEAPIGCAQPEIRNKGTQCFIHHRSGRREEREITTAGPIVKKFCCPQLMDAIKNRVHH